MPNLKRAFNELMDLQAAISLLGWTNKPTCRPAAPKTAATPWPRCINIIHAKSTAPEIGQLLEDLRPVAARLDPNSDDARLINFCQRDYSEQVALRMGGRFAHSTSLGHSASKSVRRTANFKYQPHLEKILGLRRNYANFFAPYTHIYDPLLIISSRS